MKKIKKSSNTSSRNSIRSTNTLDSGDPVNIQNQNEHENNIEKMHSILVESLNIQLNDSRNNENKGSKNLNEIKDENGIENNNIENKSSNSNGAHNVTVDKDNSKISKFQEERTGSDTVQSTTPPFSHHSIESTTVSTTQDEGTVKIPATASDPCRPGIGEEKILDREIPTTSTDINSSSSSNHNNVKNDNNDKVGSEIGELNELNTHNEACSDSGSNDAIALQSVMAALNSALNSPANPQKKERKSSSIKSDVNSVQNENENENESQNRIENEVGNGNGNVDVNENGRVQKEVKNEVEVEIERVENSEAHRDLLKVEKELVAVKEQRDSASVDETDDKEEDQVEEDEEEEEEEAEEEEDGDDEEEEEVGPGTQNPQSAESAFEGSDVSEENADIEDIEVSPKSGI